jgi:hypothetical protein
LSLPGASAAGRNSFVPCSGFVLAGTGRGGLSRAGFAGRSIFGRRGAFATACLVATGVVGRTFTFGADRRCARAATGTLVTAFASFGFLAWRLGDTVTGFVGFVVDDRERVARAFVVRTLGPSEARTTVERRLERVRATMGA